MPTSDTSVAIEEPLISSDERANPSQVTQEPTNTLTQLDDPTRQQARDAERDFGRGLRVVDGERRPIVDAWVSWAPTERLEKGRALELDHAANLARSVHTRTDSEGEFRLSLSTEDIDEEGVLWVTHPEHRPAWARFERPSDLPADIVLLRAGPLRVQVVDADGRAVADAELLTFLTDQPTTSDGADLDPAVQAAFVRSATTDEDGRAILPPAIAEQHVIAYAGSLRSAPFYGRAPAEIRLQLGEWSWVRGRVQAFGGVDLDAELFVTSAAWAPASWKTLGRASVREDGSFGPTVVPHDREAQLLLRLEGPGVLPFERTTPFPPAGSSTEVTLEAHPALRLAVQVVDQHGSPLHLADLRAWWVNDGAWIHSYARTDAEGMAMLSIRPGEIHVQAQRSGFADQAPPARTVEHPVTEPMRIQMDRAGMFKGRVMRESEPVHTFRVEYWTEDRSGSGFHHEQDRADGSYRVEGAPLGEIKVMVTEAGWPPSPLHRLILVPGVEGELTIEMPTRMVGRGSLVDAITGSPVGPGRVSTWLLEGSLPDRPTGVEAVVDSEGVFELLGLAPGPNFLVIDVPGYAQVQRLVQAQGESPVDLGRFGFVRDADLTVRLTAPKHLDPTTCRVRIAGMPSEQERRFGPDSTVVFPGQASGRVQVMVTLPDGVQIREAAVFRGGAPGFLEVLVDDEDGESLEVVVEGLGDQFSRPFLHSSTQLGPDERRERIVDLVDGRARIMGPFAETVLINLWDGAGSALMSRLFTKEDLVSGRVVLQFEDERVTLRLLDRRRDPLAAVEVVVTSIPDSGWGTQGVTDSTGRLRLAFAPEGRHLLHARFADGGGMADVELPKRPAGGDEIEVILDPTAELAVRFADRGHALQGIRGHLVGAAGRRSLALQGSDASGLARSGPIGPGAYRVSVYEHDLWPILESVEVRPGANEITIELRRLGGLRLEAQLPGGVALAGAAVALIAEEFQSDVADWIAQGKIAAPPGVLVTDERGELLLGGLPNGPYRYRLTAPDGRTASGVVDVPPHGEGRVTVTLAPP